MADATASLPVELAVIEFPGNRFNGEIAPALAELVDSGTIQILDLVIVIKDDDGSVTGIELADADADVAAAFDTVDGDVGGLLSDEDLESAGELLNAGSSAALIVWRNSWAQRLADAVVASGGRLVAHDRLDAETVAAALAESTES
jgi:uncharacterized membrane protein